MTTALLFPGQGEQHPGMLGGLPPGSRALLATVSDVLGEDASRLDSVESLSGTRGAQLSLLIAGVAWSDAAREAGLGFSFTAGHSIGMWAAAVAADSIDFDTALRLVDIRARAMAEASPPGSGMLAIDGLTLATVESIAEALRSRGGRVWASNVNAPSQVVLSGVLDEPEELESRLADAGARRIARLAVAVPAHSPLMEPARATVRRALEDVVLRRPAVPIAGNSTGQTIFTAEQLRTELSESIPVGVRWGAATGILAERGVNVWVQVPPGRRLLDLTPAGGIALSMQDLGVAETVRRATIRSEVR